MISCIFDLFNPPPPPKLTFDLFLTFFNVFGISGLLGGLLLLNTGVNFGELSALQCCTGNFYAPIPLEMKFLHPFNSVQTRCIVNERGSEKSTFLAIFWGF